MLHHKTITTSTKALGYLRISDKKQMKGESIANQKASIENYAKANNIEIIEWFKDEAKSGKNADREELQKLLITASSMKGQIAYVVVYKMSRASRDVESYVVSIRSVLATMGIQIRSATEPFDDSPTGRFMENFYVGMAQWDNDNKREMVVDNMTRIAQQGFWQHKSPRGYQNCKIKNNEGKPRPSIKPDHESSLVKDLLLRWNRGDLNEAKLTRYAASIGLKGNTGNPLTQEVVHKLIVNPVYAGYICDKFTNFERVEGVHEPLISRQVFEQNQLIFKMKNKDYLIGLKHQKTNELFPLRRFIRCATCGNYMTASKPKNSPRYYCHRRSCNGSGSIMTRTMHTRFEELLGLVTPSRGTSKLLKELLKRQVKLELGNVNQDIRRVRAELDTNDAYQQKILSKFINDQIDEREKETAMREANAGKLIAELELNDLEKKQSISLSSIDYALNFMADISERWSTAPLELKHAYQELVFPDGFEYDIKTGNFITPNISPLYRLELNNMGAIDDKNFSLVILPGIEPGLPG